MNISEKSTELKDKANYIIETYGDNTLASDFAQAVINYLDEREPYDSLNETLSSLRSQTLGRIERRERN